MVQVLNDLKEISPSGDVGENELLDENMPIAKTLKEVTTFSPKNDNITDKDLGKKTDVRLPNLPQKHFLSEAIINLCTLTPPVSSIAQKSKSSD